MPPAPATRHRLAVALVGGLCLAAAPVSAPPRSAPATPPTAVAPPSAYAGPVTPDTLEDWARGDPLKLIAFAHEKATAPTLRGFRATLHKRERLGDELGPTEVIDVALRVEPYAVRMLWKSGARQVVGSPVEGLVYASGENNGRLLVWRPAAPFLKVLRILPSEDQAKSAARYSIAEVGFAHVAARTARAWTQAAERGKLNYEYRGHAPASEVGGRDCFVLTRTCDPLEVDGFALADPPGDPAATPAQAIRTATIWIDRETGLQLGTELKRADGELLGSYFFADVRLNPHFAAGEFAAGGLAKPGR